MISNVLRNFVVWVDGFGKMGDGDTCQLPNLNLTMEDYRGGGMDIPVEVDLGMEKMEAEFSLTSFDPHTIGLFGLAVAPECRGQGIGVQLIEHLIDLIRGRGGKRVGLDVALINPRAEALYQRIGFEVTGNTKSTLSNAFGTVPDFHRMERDV